MGPLGLHCYERPRPSLGRWARGPEWAHWDNAFEHRVDMLLHPLVDGLEVSRAGILCHVHAGRAVQRASPHHPRDRGPCVRLRLLKRQDVLLEDGQALGSVALSCMAKARQDSRVCLSVERERRGQDLHD